MDGRLDGGTHGRAGGWPDGCRWAVADRGRPALVAAVVGFKLLEWWYSQVVGSTIFGAALPHIFIAFICTIFCNN